MARRNEDIRSSILPPARERQSYVPGVGIVPVGRPRSTLMMAAAKTAAQRRSLLLAGRSTPAHRTASTMSASSTDSLCGSSSLHTESSVTEVFSVCKQELESSVECPPLTSLNRAASAPLPSTNPLVSQSSKKKQQEEQKPENYLAGIGSLPANMKSCNRPMRVVDTSLLKRSSSHRRRAAKTPSAWLEPVSEETSAATNFF